MVKFFKIIIILFFLQMLLLLLLLYNSLVQNHLFWAAAPIGDEVL